MHISTVNVSHMGTDRANIAIALNIMLYVGFLLGCLELTVTYSNGQLIHRNGVWPYILTFLYYLRRLPVCSPKSRDTDFFVKNVSLVAI